MSHVYFLHFFHRICYTVFIILPDACDQRGQKGRLASIRKEKSGILFYPEEKQMSIRKELKQKGKASMRKHYLIFAAVCLISAFLASEFKGSLNFSTLQEL